MDIAVLLNHRGEVNSVNKEFAMELVVVELMYWGTSIHLQEERPDEIDIMVV